MKIEELSKKVQLFQSIPEFEQLIKSNGRLSELTNFLGGYCLAIFETHGLLDAGNQEMSPQAEKLAAEMIGICRANLEIEQEALKNGS